MKATKKRPTPISLFRRTLSPWYTLFNTSSKPIMSPRKQFTTLSSRTLFAAQIIQYIPGADHRSPKLSSRSHALSGTRYSIHFQSRLQVLKAVVSMSSRCRLERAYGLSGTRFSINPQSRSQVPKAGMSSERKLSVVRTAQHVPSTDGRTSKAIHPDVVSSARSQWYTWLNMCLEPMVGPQRNLHDVISSSRSLNGEHC
jgi:hypothetical protein